jgi:hypothetical protein
LNRVALSIPGSRGSCSYLLLSLTLMLYFNHSSLSCSIRTLSIEISLH